MLLMVVMAVAVAVPETVALAVAVAATMAVAVEIHGMDSPVGVAVAEVVPLTAEHLRPIQQVPNQETDKSYFHGLQSISLHLSFFNQQDCLRAQYSLLVLQPILSQRQTLLAIVQHAASQLLLTLR